MCNAIDKPKIGTKQDLSGSTIVRVGHDWIICLLMHKLAEIFDRSNSGKVLFKLLSTILLAETPHFIFVKNNVVKIKTLARSTFSSADDF